MIAVGLMLKYFYIRLGLRDKLQIGKNLWVSIINVLNATSPAEWRRRGKMNEIEKEELLAYWKGIMLFLSNQGWTEPDKRAEAIEKLIEDTYAYDERIDEIVEHYRRQDSTHRVTKLGLTCPDCGKKVAIDLESGQAEWLDSEPKVVDEEVAKAREYFNQVLTQNVNPEQFNMKHIQIIDEAIKQLLSQKPRDYDQNLADCTEAIDALIEERDVLIEDLEHRRVVTRAEILSVVKRINDEITPGGMSTARMVEIAYEELGVEVK